jgi:hypothetical protein
MPDYRIYKRTCGGHIQGVPLAVVLSDDEAAIRHAKFLQSGQDFEVWQGGRPVAVLKADALSTIAGNASHSDGGAPTPHGGRLSAQHKAPGEATASTWQSGGNATGGRARR